VAERTRCKLSTEGFGRWSFPTPVAPETPVVPAHGRIRPAQKADERLPICSTDDSHITLAATARLSQRVVTRTIAGPVVVAVRIVLDLTALAGSAMAPGADAGSG
jgi:hypothetical protein